MLQPDSSEPGSAAPDPTEQGDREAGLFLAHLASTLAAHGGGAASSDLALDLVLNEIVEQARLATMATSAAIALVRGDEMICRATSGANAPGLGVRISMRSGLSGVCVATGQVQHCDDTETDPRVDAAACRDFEIRSILVVPVLSREELLGVFEILSPRPQAFGDRDIQTLQALSRRIVSNIQRAADAEPVATAAPTPAETPATPALVPVAVVNEIENEAPAPEPVVMPPPRISQPPPRDYWTGLLTAVVLVLALLLGWMVGRAGWQSAMGPRATRTAPAASPPAAQLQPPSATPKIPPDTAPAPPATGSKRSGATTANPPKAAADPLPDGLVVYEKGKVIFRMTPRQSAKSSATASAIPVDPEGSSPAPITLSPEETAAYLLERIEPEYPESARQQHLQGNVVVDAIVSREGKVRDVNLIRGDAQLATAAMDAVRQWRFRPYQQDGQPAEFQTRIVVKFTLP